MKEHHFKIEHGDFTADLVLGGEWSLYDFAAASRLSALISITAHNILNLGELSELLLNSIRGLG